MINKHKPINIFDFDGTLTNETWPKFGTWINKFGYNGKERNKHLEQAISEYRDSHEGEDLDTFFGFFNDLLVNNSAKLTYNELLEGEQYIQYNQGVINFFENSNMSNHIVSGNVEEFLKGLKLSKYFESIYGTNVIDDEDGLIIGFGNVMTDDKKISSIRDILKKSNRELNDCSNVYFIGDGYSDAPAMRFVHDNGGKSIFVYQEDKKDHFYEHNNKIYEKLNSEGIIDFRCVADFRDNSELSNILNRL